MINNVLLEHGINLMDFKRGHMYYSQESYLETELNKKAILLVNKLASPLSSLDPYLPSDLVYKIAGTEYSFTENESPASRDFILTQQLPENESFSLELPNYLSAVDQTASTFGLGKLLCYLTFIKIIL